MRQDVGIYNLLHIGFASTMDSIRGRNIRRKLDRMYVLTTPVSISTADKKKKNSHIFFHEQLVFRHEKERFFLKTDGFSLEYLQYLQRTDEIEYERVQKSPETPGNFFKTVEKIPETVEKSPKTLCVISEALQDFSDIPGILTERLQNLPGRRGNLPGGFNVAAEIRGTILRDTQQQTRG